MKHFLQNALFGVSGDQAHNSPQGNPGMVESGMPQSNRLEQLGEVGIQFIDRSYFSWRTLPKRSDRLVALWRNLAGNDVADHRNNYIFLVWNVVSSELAGVFDHESGADKLARQKEEIYLCLPRRYWRTLPS